MVESRPRRRKCRRPSFASEDKALRYAVGILKQQGRTAYPCTNHDVPVFHLHPKGHERTA